MVPLYLTIFSILLNNPAFSYEKLLDHNVPIEEKDKGCFLKKSRQITSSEYLEHGVLDSHKYTDPDKDSENLRKTPNAKRDGLKLILKTEKGPITLKDKPNAEHVKNYYFVEENKKCNFFLMFFIHGEYSAWLMVSKDNGKTVKLIGKPYISNDCKKLISFDRGPDTTNRGIQFVEYSGDGYREMCHEKKEYKWRYHGGYWDGGNFFFQIGRSDNKKSMQPPKEFYYNWFFKFTN
tara:strand:- start:622 stop:1326 length:705 start_codon:yes stop_codon:yes gene_type:complete